MHYRYLDSLYLENNKISRINGLQNLKNLPYLNIIEGNPLSEEQTEKLENMLGDDCEIL